MRWVLRQRWRLCALREACFWPRLSWPRRCWRQRCWSRLPWRLLGKLSPQLPVMALTVPLKTLTGFVILTGSLALWPRFIEARFAGLLDMAERLISVPGTGVGG